MKKFSTFMVLIIASLMAFHAQAYTLPININNPNAVESVQVVDKTNWEYPITVMNLPVQSVVNVSFGDDANWYVVITAKEGFVISDCYYQNSYGNNTAFTDNYYESYSISLSSRLDTYPYTFFFKDLTTLRTNTAIVVVEGDVSKVNLQFSGTYLNAKLVQGPNQVKFMDIESTFTIAPATYGQNLYKVFMNGVEQPDMYGRWTLSVANNNFILIQADYPKTSCAVSFDFEEAGTEAYVTDVQVNGESVANWQAGFTAYTGDNLSISVDTENYKLNDFRINGVSKNINGTYELMVEEAMEFYFDVRLYGTCTATVYVDTPANVLYGVGYSHSVEYAQAVTSPFTVEVAEKMASSYTACFKAATGDVYIKKVMADEFEISRSYDGSYSLYISDGMEIHITTDDLVREDTAYLYFHNPEASANNANGLYGYSFSSSFVNSWGLSQGYNELEFGVVDNPFKMQVNGTTDVIDGYVYLYKNDELQTRDVTGTNLVWTLNLEQDDVVKVYVQDTKVAPDTYTVEFSFEGELPAIVCDYVRKISVPKASRATEASITVLPGTHVTLMPSGAGEVITGVKVGDVDLVADANGNYTFEVYEDISSKVVTGVSDVFADDLRGRDTRVFNLQGVEVMRDNLPAGIYISGGRKIIVR